MFDYSEEVNTKLVGLAAIDAPVSGQLIRVRWPDPVGDHWYVPMDYRTLNDFGYNKIQDVIDPQRIYTRLSPNFQGAEFRIELKHSGGIDDDAISFELGDLDYLIRNIFFTFGADCLVQVFRWIPQINLLLEEWWGFLDAPSSFESNSTTFTASLGSRLRRSQFPHRLRGAPGCQAAGFGGRFATQSEIDECGCPSNVHIGGAVGIAGFNDCPQQQLSDCIARLGQPTAEARWLGSNITRDGRAIVYSGAGLSSSSSVKGNNTRSNQPFALMLGGSFTAYKMGVMDMIADSNPKPENAARRVLADFSEGPIVGVNNVYIDDRFVQPQHFQFRDGTPGQPPSGFVGNVNNYSFLAHASMATFGNDPTKPADSIVVRGDFAGGYRLQRIYTTPESYTLGNSNLRAWALYTALTNKLFGIGDAHSLYLQQDFIDLAATDSEGLNFTDRHGVARSCQRSTFAHYFDSPIAEDELIKQITLWGGYTPRIQFGGKYRFARLDKRPDLSNVPKFWAYNHDGGLPANICAVGANDLRTTLKLEQPVNPRDLVYQLNVSFCDASINYKQRTLTIDDADAQTDLGRKMGEYRFRQGAKPCFALGITDEAQVLYHAEQILAHGEFFSGGLRCNQPISFQVWWKTALLEKLHEYKIIEVDSWNPNRGRYDLPTVPETGEQRFKYYIILRLQRLRNNQVRVVCQAYDQTFFDRESVTTPPEITVGSTPYPISYEPANPSVNGDQIITTFQPIV